MSDFTAYRGHNPSNNSFVASNDPSKPTVAFLGRGPGHRRSRDDDVSDDVMYVGSSFTAGDSLDGYHLRQYSTGVVSRALPPRQLPFMVSNNNNNTRTMFMVLSS